MPRNVLKDWVRTELWDQVPISIGVIDKSFEIIEANRFFTVNYGDWRNRPCYQVYKGKSKRCEPCPAAQSFIDGQIRVQEERGLVRGGKQIHYIVHMIPLVREDGEIPCVIEMSTDITTLKQLERAKLDVERLAAVGQTVAGLAHGIKNVLMGLEGGMYVVRSGMEKGSVERILKGWEMMEEDIARISTFVKEFLDFAKGRAPDVKVVDPNRPARKVIDLFREKARLAGIQLSGDLQPDIPKANMDEEAIHTCLTNLVSNALDACEISDKPSRSVVLKTRNRDRKLIYEVVDDGTGMDYDVKKKIFTNFFTTKGSDKGTGLGLLTTRKIVQQHGGKVSFESTEGVGSVFRLEFPRDQLPRPDDGEEN